ncbi:TPA: terminase, partial [Escherichia coli]|nr:terminase [Escherichia coli O17]EHS0464097.1 terminase [Escherichia coli]EIX4566091.1 terminase [Escherichia coli]EKP7838260.1 terminase [Escherichia coli]HCO9076791.1 terminase [Escherichia coli]
LTDADSMAVSLKLFREAMHLNPNAGVKREIATLSRALKKAGQDEAAAAQEPAAQKDTTREQTTTPKAKAKAKRG